MSGNIRRNKHGRLITKQRRQMRTANRCRFAKGIYEPVHRKSLIYYD